GILLKAAEEAIKTARGRLILIETSSTPAYEKTRSFYGRHGYEEIARVPDFYETGDNKLIFQKRFK
ncbi:MAG: GNAT family N-acetyltransferase, partial [Dehalococcoidia bacterium]